MASGPGRMLGALVYLADRLSIPRRRLPATAPARRRGRRLLLVAAANLVLASCAAVSLGGVGVLATVFLCEPCLPAAEAHLDALWNAPEEAAAALIEQAYLLRDFAKARQLGLAFLERTEVPHRLDRLDAVYRRITDHLFDMGERTRDLPLLGAIARRAVRFDPNDALAWFFLGRTARAQDDHVTAEQALGRAFALKPYMHQIALELSDLYASTARPRDGRRVLEREAEVVDRMLDMPEWWRLAVVGLGDHGSVSHLLRHEACRPTRKTLSFPVAIRGLDVGFAAVSMLAVTFTAALPIGDGPHPRRASIVATSHLVEDGPGRWVTWIPRNALLTEHPVIRLHLPAPLPAGAPLVVSFEVCRSRLLQSLLPAPIAPGVLRLVSGTGEPR